MSNTTEERSTALAAMAGVTSSSTALPRDAGWEQRIEDSRAAIAEFTQALARAADDEVRTDTSDSVLTP